MLRKALLGLVLGVAISGIGLSTILVSAEENPNIPSWIKNTAKWWGEGQVGDSDFVNSIQWLIENKILKVSTTEDDEWKTEAAKLFREKQGLEIKIKSLEGEIESHKKNISRLSKINAEFRQQVKVDTAVPSAEFVKLEAYYDPFDNELLVAVYFTDNDANYVKPDGTGTISVTELDNNLEDVGVSPWLYEVEFEEDGFLTWRDDSGLKHTAYRFFINQEFEGKALYWEVSMDITLEDGYTGWSDVTTMFTSAETKIVDKPIPLIATPKTRPSNAFLSIYHE